MKKDKLRIPDYLDHILEAIERIDRYIEDLDEVGFMSSQIVQDAVIRNIEVIGEASRNIQKHDPQFTDNYPDIPWEEIYLMRNRVSHGYFSVDLQVVWNTIIRDLPELSQEINNLRQALAIDESKFSP